MHCYLNSQIFLNDPSVNVNPFLGQDVAYLLRHCSFLKLHMWLLGLLFCGLLGLFSFPRVNGGVMSTTSFSYFAVTNYA